MKQDRQGENQLTKMPHVSPGQESGPGAQSLNRGVRDSGRGYSNQVLKRTAAGSGGVCALISRPLNTYS
jgi:hypothetical protein